MRCSSLAVLAVGGALALSGCAARLPATPACVTPAAAGLSAELLFGLSIPGGGTVDAGRFDGFVATELTPRFPAGFTVLPGYGQWQDAQGKVIAEGARLVMVAAPDTPDTAARLQAVRNAYRLRFHQRSVGLITMQSCAAF